MRYLHYKEIRVVLQRFMTVSHNMHLSECVHVGLVFVPNIEYEK